ncbi:MAG: hypothetical protein BGO29_09955 [Bacteroidales bacterium 36-12]|nr:MAG: hypothetical protein BGO29_09955 [Bacteroidales bacterium 36-12]
MKRNIKFLIAVLLLSSFGTSSFGKDVYVYSGEGGLRHTLTGVRKITFTSTEMNVAQSGNAAAAIPLADFDFFTFEPKAISSTFPQEAGNGISVSFDGSNVLRIHSENTISNVELYSIQGTKLQTEKPMQHNPALSLASYPAGAYLVNIASGGKIVTCKIVKK